MYIQLVCLYNVHRQQMYIGSIIIIMYLYVVLCMLYFDPSPLPTQRHKYTPPHGQSTNLRVTNAIQTVDVLKMLLAKFKVATSISLYSLQTHTVRLLFAPGRQAGNLYT